MKNIHEKIQKIFVILIFLIIIFIGAITIENDNELSKNEGRYLVKFPEFTWESLIHSNTYIDYTNAFSDQLAFREELIEKYYFFDFQKRINGVVKGDDNQLFATPLIIQNKQKYKVELKNTIANDMNFVADSVKEEGAQFIFLSIPRKDVAMSKYLPKNYYNGEKEYLEFMNIINDVKSENLEILDAYSIFKEKENKCYDVFYKTDHHLNIRGGYYLFNKILNRVNQDGYNIEINDLENEYDIGKSYTNGSFNRKIGQSISYEIEELGVSLKNNNVKYTRIENGEISNIPIFGKDNTYASAYMGGDYPETVIKTDNDSSLPNILYVGTSYTNIFEALSINKFKTVVSVDYRHNKTGNSIVDYVKKYDIDYVIYINSNSDNALNIDSIKLQLGL